METEGTGYDADIDLSDISKPNEATIVRPPSPAKSIDATDVDAEELESRETLEDKTQPDSVPPFPTTSVPPPVPVSERPPPPPVPIPVPERALPPPVPSSERPPPPPVPVAERAAPPPIPVGIPPIPAAAPPVPGAAPPVPGAAPPVPGAAPPIPGAAPPVPPTGDFAYEDEDSSSSDEEGNASLTEVAHPHDQPLRSQTLGVPPVPPPSNIPPIIPPVPRRANTEAIPQLAKAPSGLDARSSLDSSRNRALKGSNTDLGQTQAEACHQQIENELANLQSSSNWWVRGELPDCLSSKIGSELIFEIDSNTVAKRGKRTIEYKDYYILFYDLSQLVFELAFETQDPKGTILLVNYFVKPVPIIRKDLLDRYHKQFGGAIVSRASQFLGTKINDDLVNQVFDDVNANKSLIPVIGNKSYGVTVYKNFNNSNVSKLDDIRAGDILWVKNGKFTTHKGIMGGKSITLGDGPENIYSAIIYEYDSKKDKFKVFERDGSGQIKKENYKIG
ncbi:uncharacterized protein SPAPADRAFT_58411, partial [Spathaspora passalidarum NRRL Y-27907]